MESTAALGLALLGRRRWRRRLPALAAIRLLAGAYLVVLAALLTATLLPVLLGWRPYLITSGSMSPNVPAGSVVLADRDGIAGAAVGDVVVVHDPARSGRLLAHRVVALRTHAGGVDVITKGDANASADSTPVPATDVIGQVRAVVPLLGTVQRNREACVLLALLAAFVVAGPRHRPRARRLPRTLVATTAVAALASAFTWQATAASFGASTHNTGSSFSAGSVQLSDNDAGSALFGVSGLLPGDSGSQCITVTYGGNVPAAVKVYASALTGSLGSYLTLTIDEGSGSCASFSSSAQLYSGTLAAFASTAGDYASGVGTYRPTGAGSITYRFAYVMGDDNTAAGSSASLDLTWEARSS